MLTMVEYVHQRIQSYPKCLIGVDMTMGNGNDTVFLAEYCREVYAFDIQKEALEETMKKVHHMSHVHLILDSHEHVDQYLDTFDIGIFNLGYLPKQDHQITTLLPSTQIAVLKSLEMVQKALFIVAYPGHEEGYKESKWLLDYVSKLDSHLYNVSSYMMLNKKNSPYVIEIQKR